MLDLSRIKEAFRLYSGEDTEDPDDARALLCASLCADCLADAQAECPQDPAPGEAGILALERWAAARAFTLLCLLDEASLPGKLTADGLSLEMGSRSQKARELAEEKRRAVCSLLGEEGFYFGTA